MAMLFRRRDTWAHHTVQGQNQRQQTLCRVLKGFQRPKESRQDGKQQSACVTYVLQVTGREVGASAELCGHWQGSLVPEGRTQATSVLCASSERHVAESQRGAQEADKFV